ncbi:MAG TPA: sialidase family protein, partial [Polyangiaceae bacterium]
PHVAVDPTDNRIVYIAYNNDLSTGVSMSRDRGQTWVHTSIGAKADPDAYADPVLAVDPSTRDLWHSYVSIPLTATPIEDPHQVHLLRATHDAGGNLVWGAPIQASDPAYYTASYSVDKPWLAVGATGTLYVAYNVFSASSMSPPFIALAISTDRGQNWRHLVVNDRSRFTGGTLPYVTTDAKSVAYLGWWESSPVTELGGHIWFSKLTSATASVGANVRVHDVPEAAYDGPQVAVTADGSILYVVYGAIVPGGGVDAQDVKASFSTNGGSNWSAPIKLNDDPSCATHWHPAAVTDSAGSLWVIYYDERYGDGRVAWVKAVVSSGALSVAARGWVTDAAPLFTTSRFSSFLGDYIGLAFAGGDLFAAWGDLREAGKATDTRIYFSQGAAL